MIDRQMAHAEYALQQQLWDDWMQEYLAANPDEWNFEELHDEYDREYDRRKKGSAPR